MKSYIFKIILVTILLNSCKSVQSDETNIKNDKVIFERKKRSINEILERKNEIANNNLKVELISTCSSDPNLCGTIAVGSLSKVKILEGSFVNEFILVGEMCTQTNYEIGKKYRLGFTPEPSFSVLLCSSKTYTSDWNFDTTNENYLTFGYLTISSDL